MGVWCEVFRPGVWNGKAFGPEVVDQIIEAFEANKDGLKVPLRVGDHESLRPAGGWVTGLKNVGGRLMAELSDVVPAVGQAINKRLYKQTSIGLWRNHKDENGKTWPWVLNHIALLGGVLPAVRGLDDIPALFEGEGDREVITLDNQEHEDMDVKVMEGLLAKADAANEALRGANVELTAQVAELTKKLEAAEKTVSDGKAELTAAGEKLKDAQTKVAEFEAKVAKAEVEDVVLTAVREGRLAPAVKDSTIATGNALREMQNFSAADSPFAAWKKALKDTPVILGFAEKARVEAENAGGPELSEFEREFAEGEKIVTDRRKAE